jgi:hypothetical protein
MKLEVLGTYSGKSRFLIKLFNQEKEKVNPALSEFRNRKSYMLAVSLFGLNVMENGVSFYLTASLKE